MPGILYTRQEPQRVLLIYGHDRQAPGVVAFNDQLRAVIASDIPERVEFYDESLDFDRLPDRSRWPNQARHIADKYRGLRFNAIVAEGAMALRFSTEELRRHFPEVPVIYGLVFEPVVDFAALPANVTGTRIEPSFAATYDLARRLQPDATHVVLVGGAAAMDSALFTAALREITPLLGGVRLTTLQDWTYDSLLRTLRGLPSRTMVIFSSFRKDQRGQTFASGDLIASIARVSPVPVYGVARNWVGDGIVGGSVMEFGDNGTHTGRLLVQVLRNPRGAALPAAQVARAPLVVDWRQLERWGLSERALPPGTEVVFRAPTFWQRYRTGILVAVAVFLAQCVLIALLLLERTRRRRAQRRLEDQAAYEQMVAELTLATVRISPVEISGALNAALRCVSEYAGANTAVLTTLSNGPSLPSMRFEWRRGSADPAAAGKPHARIELSLNADGAALGTLVLTRCGTVPWPPWMVARLRSAAELVAGALARARAAHALEETRSQVAHMARVATMGELAAAVSHELRQPLGAIRANAEAGALVLAQTSPDVEVAREIFQDIVEDDVRAAQVIEHLRMLFRKDNPITTTVDVNDVCRHAVHLVEREAAFRGVELELNLEPDLAPVRGDVVQLQQIVLNLTMNALDATADADTRRVMVGTALRGEVVEISVRDTGAGLSPQTREHLFESFFSSKPHGLGMGLAIVRSIVERHHGQVYGDNDPSGGARFRVLLPVDST